MKLIFILAYFLIVGANGTTAAVFSYDGNVTNIAVVKGAPGEYTQSAIEAARKIKFVPAAKDGVPVSMWMQLEYRFPF